jgi:hypothetical protein
MPKVEAKDYLPVESYKGALEAFHVVCALILFEFARQNLDTRDTIIRNFVARTDMTMRAVFRLYDIRDFQDCWILYRCLLDRLFHLYHLDAHNQFEVFEEWSFIEQFNALNRVRSDPEFKAALESKSFDLTSEQKTRAKAIAKNPPAWQRPKAEEVARQLSMQFLYRFGYDYGSMHVHPMADDGLQDFFTITQLEPAPGFPEQRSVLSNTLLVAKMTVQQGLNSSNLSWRALVYDFLDHLMKLLDTGSEEYKTSSLKLTRMSHNNIRLAKMPVNTR